MIEIILDTNAPQGEALKAVNVAVTIDMDTKSLHFSGKIAIPYQGTQMLMALPGENNIRIAELEDVTSQMQAGEFKTKNEAKIALGNTAFEAIETAITTYLQAVYLLNNPVIEEGE